MKRRFLLHHLSHTFLVIDISEIGIPASQNAINANTQMVPAIRFTSWKEAEQYLGAKGATPDLLEQSRTWLRKSGASVLTVL